MKYYYKGGFSVQTEELKKLVNQITSQKSETQTIELKALMFVSVKVMSR